MKREYNFTSILLIQTVSAIVIGIFNYFFSRLNIDNVIVRYISSFIIWFIGFIFNYIIAAGLLNNRNGSFGDYFNQINTLSPTIIITNVMMAIIVTLASTLLFAFGGLTSFLMIANSMSRNVAPASTFIMFLIIGILYIIFFLLTSYINFVLADRRERYDGVGDYIRRIFKVGKDLLGKTFVTYLKYIIAPVLLYVILSIVLATMMSQNSGAFVSSLIIILTLILLVYLLISSIILQARLSDNYLDYTGDTIVI